MAQHDYAIADQNGLSFLADLNNALSAIVSNNSGATEPTDTFPYMFWVDTNAGILKQRNAADDGWINKLSLTGTAAEIANNLSDLASASTAFDNIKQTATTASTGVVEKATPTEMTNGTTDKYPDAETVNNFAPSQDQSTWNTGTDTTESRISAGKLDAKIVDRFNASGDAPFYACRAWVNFNGTGTVAIRASGNVSSITDNGAGDYTVNFATSLPDSDFQCVVDGLAGGITPTRTGSTPSNSSSALIKTSNNSGVETDLEFISFSATR